MHSNIGRDPELIKSWAEHPDLFIAPAKEEDPERRALLVLKWFLATLKGQYSSRNEEHGSEKKPLNPMLGEQFLGSWKPSDGSETKLVSEQVSHHPPVTAYAIYNEAHGILLNGHNGQKASISGVGLTIKQLGHALLHLKKFNETYLITFPFIRIEGVLMGSPYIELEKDTYIHSNTGYTAKVDYSGKGYFSGKKNSFKAELSKSSRVLYTVTGVWTEACEVGEGQKPKYTAPFLDLRTDRAVHVGVHPVSEQSLWESRRIWENVAKAIAKGDMQTTSQEKSKLENWQRDLRKKEQEEIKAWQQKFFTWTDPDPQYDQLAKDVDVSTSEGSWVWRG